MHQKVNSFAKWKVLTLKNLKPEIQKTAGTKEAVDHCIIVIDPFFCYYGESL